MFLNNGYTRQVIFARRRVADSFNNVKLQITGFSSDEITDHFRPCAVDPGRRDAFTSYHGNDNIWRLATKEYYHASGSGRRMMLEDNRKRQADIKEIEINIPTAKVTNDQHYLERIIYMQNILNRLFDFYNFRVTEINWKTYRGGQKALDDCTNILVNGSAKYNKGKRKKKNRLDRRKRRRITNRWNPGVEDLPVVSGNFHRRAFQTGDTTKMPLVVFGDGLTNKSSARFRDLRHGVPEKIYKHLRLKEKLGELYLLDIDEFRTSQVCNSCKTRNLRHYQAENDKSIHSILICSECNIFWNRDVMAAKNMFYIAEQN
ncbi:hypothetical protein RMATCC62417_12259 [Rhizopus microsporus]|nr:hypothetical protein RMATCC62417_12259 [Rhizopus microsporus]